MSTNPSPSQDTQYKTLWILWGALLMSLGIYAFLGVIVKQEATDPELLDALWLVFIMLGVGTTGATFFVRRSLREKKQRTIQAYFTYCILSWALSESIAIYGLVRTFLGGEPVFLFALTGWSALLFVIFRPSQEEWDHFNH